MIMESLDWLQIHMAARRLPYEERAGLAKCELGRTLFQLMARKQTNLAVAADVPTCAQVLALADQARVSAD